MTSDQIRSALASLTEKECESLLHDWRFFARAAQIAPDGDWLTWLILAGRGFGKTRTGAEWVRERVQAGAMRLHLIAPTASDARDVMVEGESGLLSVCWAGDRTYTGEVIGRPSYEPSKRRLTWANGAVATLFSAEEPERLRGPQCEVIWADELAAWKYLRETWDMAMFGLRLGVHPQTCITTTPKPLALLKEIAADPRTAITRGSTFDNATNLAPTFLKAIRDKYEGTRLGRQELNAEILEDVPGALWSRDNIDETRVSSVPPNLSRIVVAVDPPASSEEGADECGIVVAGRVSDSEAYVMADLSKGQLTPNQWAERAVAAYHEFDADCIVAEVNNGGEMVRSVLLHADPTVPVRMVRASRGKAIRAEPIANLYEQGRVHHVGTFATLEDQMCAMTLDYDRSTQGSPDRLDALVWAMTDLMPAQRPRNLRII